MLGPSYETPSIPTYVQEQAELALNPGLKEEIDRDYDELQSGPFPSSNWMRAINGPDSVWYDETYPGRPIHPAAKDIFQSMMRAGGYTVPNEIIVDSGLASAYKSSADRQVRIREAVNDMSPEKGYILKPLSGSGGRGIYRFTPDEMDQMMDFISMICDERSYIVQELMPISDVEARWILHKREGLPDMRFAFKKFAPSIYGDGSNPLFKLIMRDSRIPAAYKVHYLLENRDRWMFVPKVNEQHKLAEPYGKKGGIIQKCSIDETIELDKYMSELVRYIEEEYGLTLNLSCFDLGVIGKDREDMDVFSRLSKGNIVPIELQLPFVPTPISPTRALLEHYAAARAIVMNIKRVNLPKVKKFNSEQANGYE